MRTWSRLQRIHGFLAGVCMFAEERHWSEAGPLHAAALACLEPEASKALLRLGLDPLQTARELSLCAEHSTATPGSRKEELETLVEAALEEADALGQIPGPEHILLASAAMEGEVGRFFQAREASASAIRRILRGEDPSASGPGIRHSEGPKHV